MDYDLNDWGSDPGRDCSHRVQIILGPALQIQKLLEALLLKSERQQREAVQSPQSSGEALKHKGNIILVLL
jgi:hypothetical protein